MKEYFTFEHDGYRPTVTSLLPPFKRNLKGDRMTALSN